MCSEIFPLDVLLHPITLLDLDTLEGLSVIFARSCSPCMLPIYFVPHRSRALVGTVPCTYLAHFVVVSLYFKLRSPDNFNDSAIADGAVTLIFSATDRT